MKNENKRRYKKNKGYKGEKKRNLLIFKFLNDAIISAVYLFGIISFNFYYINYILLKY